MKKKTLLVFPKNKKQFLNLIKFYQKLAPILKKAKIEPIASGSFAYFIYTNDSKARVNDFDFLIQKNKFPSLIAGLSKAKIKCKYLSDWESLEVKDKKLKIDFDSLERYYLGKAKRFVKKDVFGIKIKFIGLDELIKAYKLAFKVSNDKPSEHKKKFEKLVLLKK
jgi:hypothetical protein